MNLELLLKCGYFPRELPHPFNSASFSAIMSATGVVLPAEFLNNRNTSIPVTHNLSRSGALRRKLGIPNPTNFFRLANFINQNKTDLFAHAQRSPISLTKPSTETSPRAINPTYTLSRKPLERAKLRASSRFILEADISMFYPSIYSHSIPWAIHTKPTAKANRSHTLVGNALDMFVRNSQDGQTIGIPIGPDTSLLIAEIILGAVDEKLMPLINTQAFRNIDDYEFGFKSYAQAENSLGLLQEELNNYELSLNPRKTHILKLPVRIEPTWNSELRAFLFRTSKKGQESDLLRYFDTAFEMATQDPDEHILKYAISRLNGIEVLKENWLLFQLLLSQCCLIEPGSLKFVIEQLARYESSFPVDKSIFEECFNDLIFFHAPLGHGSEVAWSVWGSILLNIPIHTNAINAISAMEDPIVALLALEAQSKGLTPHGYIFNHFATHMSKDDLYNDHWLLAYEANIKGWLPSASTIDNVESDPCFKFLKQNGVSFYDNTLNIDCAVVKTLSGTPPTGEGGIGGFY
jgi:reverse transcriptase-like protein